MQTRRLVALLIPDGAVLALAGALVYWTGSSPEVEVALRIYPPAVLAAGVWLSWRFQRGRLFLALAGLVVADYAMRWLLPFDVDASHAGPVVVRALTVLLSASFVALAWIPERGITTPAGYRRLAVFTGAFVILLALWLLTALQPDSMARAFDATMTSAPWLAGLPLGQPATLAASLAIGTLAVRALWRNDAASRGFLWAAVGCVVALSTEPASGHARAYLGNVALVLVVATVEGVYAMAYQDELTGLPARRALNDALLRAGGGVFTVAMVDVDHFKQFNDTHGHDVGDQVLRMVAQRLADVTGGGRAYRYGGEEFALLFPNRTAAETAPHLEALRASVADAAFRQRGLDRPRQRPSSPRSRGATSRALAVTVSIGAAQARGVAPPDEVVKAADKALYRAKEAGRNRVAM